MGDSAGWLERRSGLRQKLRAPLSQTCIIVSTLRDALIHYERSLETPNARFDRYLRGDSHVLSAPELRGYQLFESYFCVACHQGVNVGGNLFQKFGIMADYYAALGITPNKVGFGRYALTQGEVDKFVFRVPSLRNVALTAPYLHDGSASTLDNVVSNMAEYRKRPTAPPIISRSSHAILPLFRRDTGWGSGMGRHSGERILKLGIGAI